MANTGGLPADFTDDTAIWPLLVDLLDCFQSELTSRKLDNLCMVFLSPGAQVDALRGEEGLAYVRLNTAFPSSTFPAQEAGTESCQARVAAQVELGIIRCISLPERGSLTSLESAKYVQVQMADYAAMRAAVRCCATSRTKQVSMGAYSPYGPEGNTYGGAMTVFLQKR